MASSYWSLVGCRPLARQYPDLYDFKLACDNMKERLPSKRRDDDADDNDDEVNDDDGDDDDDDVNDDDDGVVNDDED